MRQGFFRLLAIIGNLPDWDKLNELHISGSGADCGSTAYCGVAPVELGLGTRDAGLGLELGLGLDWPHSLHRGIAWSKTVTSASHDGHEQGDMMTGDLI